MRTHASRFPARAASLAAAGALVAATGCTALDPIERPAPVTGNADFSSYVAIGTSLSMGIQSNGLVEDLQAHSFPALVAAAAGANGGSFVQPLVPTPGIPPVLEVTGVTTAGLPILVPRPGTPPVAPSTPRPIDGYDNLGISGALTGNALTRNSGEPPNNYFDLVLQGQGTMIRQCLAQRPTFVTVEFGSNELILAVLRGDPAFMLSAPVFQAAYTQLLDSLAIGAPDARLALVNVTDLTDVAYATAIKPDLTGPYGPGGATATIRLRDAAGPLADDAQVLPSAAALIPLGYGFPAPAPPLPDSVVITPAEKATIQGAIASYNSIIAAAAQQRGAALADVHSAFARAHQDGVVLGGVHYSTSYLTGGLYSFDGVHPSSLGHGLYANEVLRAVNAKYGATIPLVDLAALTR